MDGTSGSTEPRETAWRIGMATRCGRCFSANLLYQEDGSARCLSCGGVTAGVRTGASPGAPPGTAPPRAAPAAPIPAPAPFVLVPAPGTAETGAPPTDAYPPPEELFRIAEADRRLQVLAVGITVVSLVFVFGGVPAIISYSPQPIIHIADFFLSGDTNTCDLDQHVSLVNRGGRAGVATVTLFVDESPYQNWTVAVPARSTVAGVEGVHVPFCLERLYTIAVTHVEAA